MSRSLESFGSTLPHISLADWRAKQWELQETSKLRRLDAYDLRATARALRNETKIKTEWDFYANTSRLCDRVSELLKWREEIEDILQHIVLEMKVLRDEATDLEKEIELLDFPLDILHRCIKIRNSRKDTELTYDDGDTGLSKELSLVEETRKLFINKYQEAWEKLKRLENARLKIQNHYEDKIGAIEIDTENWKFDPTSTNISFKTFALKNPQDIISYESWLENCRYIKKLGDEETSNMYDFRESMHLLREKKRNEIKAQQDSTDFSLRKRIYETQKGKNEMAWQKLKLEKEMESVRKEIELLENELVNKTGYVQCAETRLDNRNYRPGKELCRDEVDLGLKEELSELKQTKESLTMKINIAKETYEALKSAFSKVTKNLEDKEHTLTTDIMCLDTRAGLKSGDLTRDRTKETDRNIILSCLEKEIPLESS